MKTEKERKEIAFCLHSVKGMLDFIRPSNRWRIVYGTTETVALDDWDKEYHKIVPGEEYLFIYIGEPLMYAINVQGTSPIHITATLMKKLADKF